MYTRAGSRAVKVRLAAVGMRAYCITSFANALDDSMRAAAWLGPNTASLAAREPGSLHHERLGVTLDVDEGRGEGGEGAARGGGDARLLHHVLCERLGRLDAGGGLAGPEHGVARRAQPVGQARREGRLRPDDGEVDVVFLHHLHNLPNLHHLDCQILSELRGAGVAGSGEQVGVGGVALQRPAERVLAAAPADDQDSHFFLKASEKAWAARLAVSTMSSTTAFASFI